MELNALPVRARLANGTWAAVDTTLRAAGGRIAPAVSAADVVFSGGGTGPAVALTVQGKRVELTWPGTLPAPVLAGDTATYPEVIPGVDLALRATPDGFSHVFVVKSPQAAASQKLSELRLGLKGGQGVTVRQGADGGLSAAGPDGKVLAVSSGAAMWDSAGNAELAKARPAASAGAASPASPGERSARSTVPMRLDQGQLVLSPDKDWLRDAKRAFPIYVDPVWHTPGATQWAYANSNNVNNSDGRAWVGRDPTNKNLLRSYFQFPIDAVAGSTVISATFNTTLSHSYSCGATPVSVWRSGVITSTPRSAWGIPIGPHLRTESGNANKDACWKDDMAMSFNVSGDVQTAVSARWVTYTLALTAADADGGNEWAADRWKKFHANPNLSINYNYAPVAYEPSTNPQTPCLTGPGRPMLGGSSSSPVPEVQLKVRVQDNADNSSATFELSHTNGAVILEVNDGRYLASGSEHQWTIPSGVLEDGKTYSWRARGHDGAQAGAFSPWCEFTVNSSAPRQPKVTSAELKLSTDQVMTPVPPATVKAGTPAAVVVTPDSNDKDIAYYKYSVGNGAAPASASTRVPAAPDGTVTLPVVPVVAYNPQDPRLNVLRLEAYDNAGNNSSSLYYFKANAGSLTSVPGDATGDGKADLSAVSDIGGGKSAVWQFTQAGSSTVASAVLENSTATAGHRVARGDFDRDGRVDVAQVVAKTGGIQVKLLTSDGNGGAEFMVWEKDGWILDNVRMLAGNIDGAPGDDLALMYNGGTEWSSEILVGDGASGSPHFTPAPHPAGSTEQTFPEYEKAQGTGDVNGDGKADLIGVTDAGGCNVAVKVWTSGLWINRTPAVKWTSAGTAQAGTWCWDKTRAAFGDFNADGKTDIAVTYEYPNCQTGVRVSYAKADGTGFGDFTEPWKSPAQNWCGASAAQAGDLNGDGKADLGVLVNVSGVAGSSAGYHHQLWTLTSSGASLAAPVLAWEGALGNRQTPSISIDENARYQLVASHSGKCVSVAGGTTSTVQLTQQACSASVPEHTVRIVHAGGSTYALRLGHADSQCLDVENGSSASGTRIVNKACAQTPANVPQIFTFSYVSGFAQLQVEIKAMHSKKCVAVGGAVTTDGGPITQWDCLGQADTRYDIHRIPDAVNGLTASWPMNDGSDATGRSENLTFNGGASTAAGVLNLDGTDDWASAPGPAIDANASFTVAAWVKLNSTTKYATAVSLEGSHRPAFYLQYNLAAGKWVFGRSRTDTVGGEVDAVAAQGAPQLGTWTHLAGVYDKTAGKIRLYVNGVLQGEAAFSQTWPAKGKLTVGRIKFDDALGDYWPGGIDGAETYNRALSTAEILARSTSFDGSQPHQLVLSKPANSDGADLCVTSPAGDIGQQLQQQPCGTALLNSQYRLERMGATEYRITGVHAPGCFDLANWGTADGTKLSHWVCNGATAQIFTIAPVSAGDDPLYEIRPWVTGKCMAVTRSSTAPGASVAQWPCTGTWESRLHIRPVVSAATDPVATWDMSEDGATVLADGTGGANATISGRVTAAGGTATFDGTTGVASATGPVLDTTKSFTVSAWAYLTSNAESAVVVGQEGSKLNAFTLSYCKGCNAWQLERAGSDVDAPSWQYSLLAAGAPQLSTWTHLVATYDATTGTQKLYLNGQLAASNTFTAPWRAQGQLTIGRGKWYGAPAAYFPGQIDDIRVYRVALDATAVGALHTGGRA
ncbi:LamG-like jellyroll fold domain-containing protein [Longispora albida]|uniref:LamG-like jellyroll fold domain-containing protein n=1 Tax=Longispora albida TaxID=203523 RepID=UPI001FE19AF8|nr:LamG-like jellyroll fold domain-containing protein [Longispora albida]